MISFQTCTCMLPVLNWKIKNYPVNVSIECTIFSEYIDRNRKFYLALTQRFQLKIISSFSRPMTIKVHRRDNNVSPFPPVNRRFSCVHYSLGPSHLKHFLYSIWPPFFRVVSKSGFHPIEFLGVLSDLRTRPTYLIIMISTTPVSPASL